MNRRIVPLLAVLLLFPGCLVIYTEKDFVRPEEKREVFRFESPEAWKTFHEALEKRERDQGTQVGFLIPFLFIYLHGVEYSENAHFNDHAMKCDADGDRAITLEEARAYSDLPREED